MTAFVNYPYYRDVYGGTLDKQTFRNISLKASAYIDKLTFGRASANADDERVKRCCCELSDTLSEISGGVKQSESVGSWSVSYAVSGNTSEINYARAACRVWLPADWLYRGVGRE